MGESRWEVRSYEDKVNMYSVQRKLQTCNCLLHCSKCGFCQHMYIGRCVDHKIRSTASKQIHAEHNSENTAFASDDANTAPVIDSTGEDISYFEKVLSSSNKERKWTQ